MGQMLKRISSLILCLALLASGWPVGAMAEEAQPATPAEAAEEPCTHAQTTESAWEEISYWPIGDEQHSVTTYAHERVECPDCGAVLKDETSVVGEAYAEAHAYNDEGICPLCAHTAPAMEIMPLSLDITEEETTRAMSLSVDTIVVGQAFSFSWSDVPSADHYEVAVTRIDTNDVEHKLLGDAAVDNRQNVGTSRSFTVSAADVAADTKRMRIFVGAASDGSFPTPWDGMIKEASATVDVRYDAAKEMDVRVSVSGDTATVEWAEVAGADHYLYKVLDQTNGGKEIYSETQTQTLSFELPGLITGHEYKIWVASYDAGGAMIALHTSQSKLLLVCHHEQTEDVESAELFGNLTETTHTRYARFDVVCKACGEVISADQIKLIGQEEHAFTGNVCDVCGYDKTDKNAVLALTVGEAISGKPLTASWNAIDGVDHYQYNVRDMTTDTPLFGEAGASTAETSFALEGTQVAADHEYKIWAAAYDASGIMLTQGTQTVTAERFAATLTLNVGPAIGGQTLIVTWNEVEGVGHYQYNIRNLSTDTPIWGETGESTQIPSLMLNGILVDDNVEYKIWVGAYDASGSMMAQTTQTVKTTAAQSNPMNLSYSGTPLAGIDLQMSWSKLSDADHYEYSLRDITTNKAVYTRVETNAAYFTIPGVKLEADHNYRFWVGAIGADGAEPNRDHQGSVVFTVTQCPHGSATPKNEETTWTSISATQHHVRKTYDLYCTYCDTVIEEGKKEEYDEKHSFDENGNCKLCGYEPPLAVTVKVDEQSAWTGDMLGADAVVTGGSGSYTYYWEVYHNGRKVDYTTDARNRYTYTANEEGQWKFVVVVTDKEDGENYWTESAVIEVKKCDHTPVGEEITDKRKIERNDQKTHTVVKTMHVTCACGEVDKTEEVREQVEHTKGNAANKTEHPHRKYFVCTVCGQEIDGGENGYNASCSTCNPPKTGNTGNQSSQGTNNTSNANKVDVEEILSRLDSIQGPCDGINHRYSAVSYQNNHPHKLVKTCQCGASIVIEGQLGYSLDCCDCGNHNWTEPYYDAAKGHYIQGCIRCFKTVEVNPSQNQYMGDLFEYYRQIGLNDIFEETALNASKKMTEAGFVYINETVNATSDMSGAIVDAFGKETMEDAMTKEWEHLITQMLLTDFENTSAASTQAEQDLLKLCDENFMEFFNKINDIDESMGKAVGYKVKKGSEESYIDYISWFAEEWAKQDDETIGAILSKGKEMLDDNDLKWLDDLRKHQDRLQAISDAASNLGDVLEGLGKASEVLNGVNEVKEIYAEQAEYVEIAMYYDQNVKKVENIIRAGKISGNTTLMQAAENVKTRLNEQMNDAFTDEKNAIREIGMGLLEGGAKKAAERLLDEAMKKAPAVRVIDVCGKAADFLLNWEEAYKTGFELQTLGVMNASVKNSVDRVFAEDVSAGYQLSEVYTILQMKGLECTKQYLNDYEAGNGLSVTEFGIKDLKGTCERIDDKIRRIEQLQQALSKEYRFNKYDEVKY